MMFHPIASLYGGMKYLLSVAEANSRFIYLMNAGATCFGVFALVLGFIFMKGDKSMYPIMLTICLGGHGVAVAGRYLNKKADGDAEVALTAANGDAAALATATK